MNLALLTEYRNYRFKRNLAFIFSTMGHKRFPQKSTGNTLPSHPGLISSEF